MEQETASLLPKLLDAGIGIIAVLVFAYLFNKATQNHEAERSEWRECINNNTKAFQQFEGTIRLLIGAAVSSIHPPKETTTTSSRSKDEDIIKH